MKRILTVFLALIIGLSMSAQIQRTIMGFTLGTTTKSEVYNKFKDCQDFSKLREGYQANYVKFGGYVWMNVCFYFYKDKLYEVCFGDQGFWQRENDVMWNDLKAKLNKKYSQYYSSSSTVNDIWYSDSKTYLNLKFKYYDTSYTYSSWRSITYTDRALYQQKKRDEENEL